MMLDLVEQCLLMAISKSPEVLRVPVKMETFIFAQRKFDQTDTQRAKIKKQVRTRTSVYL